VASGCSCTHVVPSSPPAGAEPLPPGQPENPGAPPPDANPYDLIFGPVNPSTLFAAPDGLHFEHAATLSHLQLDEDSGTFENIGDNGMDEIYVGARLLDRSGNTISKVESNRITGDL